MKIYSMVIAFSLLVISSKGLSYESYDFSPMDDSEYMSGYGNDNSSNYNDSNRYEKRDYYRPQRDNNRNASYSKPSKSQYVGGGKAFVFDPKNLRWYAYYNGNLINSGRASGGRFYCPDIGRPCKTPVGVFRVGHKGGPECKSSKYPVGRGNAPMPYCMFFRGGFAIHGGMVPNFNASHGCIRVPHPDARWLSKNFLSPGSTVVVKSYR